MANSLLPSFFTVSTPISLLCFFFYFYRKKKKTSPTVCIGAHFSDQQNSFSSLPYFSLSHKIFYRKPIIYLRGRNYNRIKKSNFLLISFFVVFTFLFYFNACMIVFTVTLNISLNNTYHTSIFLY